MRRILVALCACTILGASVASGAGLPGRGPVPVPKPVAETPVTPPVAETPAAPPEQEKPQNVPAPEEKPSGEEAPNPAETPVPLPKPPHEQEDGADASKPDVGGETATKPDDTKAEEPKDGEKGEEPVGELQGPPAPPAPPPPPPIETEDEEAFAECTAELTNLGARFTTAERIDDGNGCGIDKPIVIESVSPKVKLEPKATLRCETALQLAQMTRAMIEPAAALGLPDKGRLTTIHQASGYICRNRNSAAEGKISEHARGNGIDIVSLEFEKATVPMAVVRQEDSDLASAFQRALNAVACLYFSTVLSPGSDASHQDHLHLDVLRRNNGYRYCR